MQAFTSDPDVDPTADDDLVLRLSQEEYQCYVFLQTEYLAQRLRPIVSGRFVIIPMYDGAAGRSDAFWRQFVNCRFVSFCRAHHEHLEALDLRSSSFRFFPEARPVPERDFANPNAFFWERRPDRPINLGLVLELCRQMGVRSLHVHAAPDFARHARATSRLGVTQVDSVSIRRSTWFDNPDDYGRVAGEAVYFFAPRMEEGIGMAILEAMSLGQIVVAPDRPTLNEYVSHGTTGLLYDPAQPQMPLRLDEGLLRRMSAAAHRRVAFGHADWLADIERLKSILLDDGKRWSTRDVSSHFMNSLKRSASLRAFGLRNGPAGSGAEA